MTNKLVQDGNVINFTSAGALTLNSLVRLGTGVYGVVGKSAAGSGELVPIHIEGVFTLDKIAAASTSLAVGQKVYARATGSVFKVLGVATGSVMGTAFAAATTGATTAIVKLHGVAV